MTAHAWRFTKPSMINSNTFVIKFKGLYNIVDAGKILTDLEKILDDSAFVATFELTWFVLSDDDFCVEVFYKADVNYTHDNIIDTVYSKVSTKYTNITVE